MIYLPSTFPNSFASNDASIVWKVIPTTWQTNFRIESLNPTIFEHNPDIFKTSSQNFWNSQHSNKLAK